MASGRAARLARPWTALPASTSSRWRRSSRARRGRRRRPRGAGHRRAAAPTSPTSVTRRRAPLGGAAPAAGARAAHRARHGPRVARDQRAAGHRRSPCRGAVALCEDPAVIGAPFYVMDFVDGHVVRDRSAAGVARHGGDAARHGDGAGRHAAHAPRRRARATSGSATSAAPTGSSSARCGAGGSSGRRRRRASCRPSRSCTAACSPAVPAQSAPGIVHGDYRFDNVIYAPDDPGRIAAVVDWEMSTIGDPLCDLGLLVVYWVTDADGRGGVGAARRRASASATASRRATR